MIGRPTLRRPLRLCPEVVVTALGGQGARSGPGMPTARV